MRSSALFFSPLNIANNSALVFFISNIYSTLSNLLQKIVPFSALSIPSSYYLAKSKNSSISFVWFVFAYCGQHTIFQILSSAYWLETDGFESYPTHIEIIILVSFFLISWVTGWRRVRFVIILINYLLKKSPWRILFSFVAMPPTSPTSFIQIQHLQLDVFLWPGFLCSFDGCCVNSGDTATAGNRIVGDGVGNGDLDLLILIFFSEGIYFFVSKNLQKRSVGLKTKKEKTSMLCV